MSAELFDAARARLATTGFDATAQTKISTFLRTAKNVNVALLGDLSCSPVTHVAQVYAHSQVFREAEAAALLARTTRWSTSPGVLVEAAMLAQPLWTQFVSCRPLPWLPQDARAVLRACALGHGLLSQIRITPCIPPSADEADPFVVALRRIDAENGRLIQLQTRLLGFAAEAVADADAIVEHEQLGVRQAFCALLESLAAGGAGQPR